MKKENLTISEIQNLVKKIISEKSEPKKELRDAYEKLKKVRKELKERGKNNSDLKKYKTTMRELADEIEEMEDDEKVEMDGVANDDVVEKNEQSEGYGTFKGLGMNENRKTVKLKESDLKRVIQRVVKESSKFTSKKKVKSLKEAPEKDTYWVISKADRENLLKMGGEAEVIGKSATNDFSKYCR